MTHSRATKPFIILLVACFTNYGECMGHLKTSKEFLSTKSFLHRSFDHKAEREFLFDEGRPPDVESSGREYERTEGRLIEGGLCPHPSEIHRSIKNLDCSKPFLKTVQLKSPGPNVAIVPSVANVKRCSGHCHHPRACLPSQTSLIRIPVYKFDTANASLGQVCVEYELEQHEQCHCTCIVKKHHCTEKQSYDPHNCACTCVNEDEKQDCLDKQDSMSEHPYSNSVKWYWDDASCKCKCLKKACHRGAVWSDKLCRCRDEGMGEEDIENLIDISNMNQE